MTIMKTKLFSIILPTLLFVLVSNAQNHTWTPGNDAVNFPVNYVDATNGGYTDAVTVDGLRIVPKLSLNSPSTNRFPVKTANYTSVDGTVYKQHLETGLTSLMSPSSSYLPLNRYLSFPVTAKGCTVKVWFRSSNLSSNRFVYVTNGTKLLGSTSASGTTTPPTPSDVVLTSKYNGTVGDSIYIYGKSSIAIFKIQVYDQTTWNGLTWSNGEPDESLEAKIEGTYSTTTNGEFSARKITINSGVLTINSGTTVTVEDEVVNNAASTDLVIENNANLIIVNNPLGLNNIAFNEHTVTVYKNKETLYVNSENINITNVKVYDLRGRLISEQKEVNATSVVISNLKETNQVLIVKITSQDNSVVTKKVSN